MAPLSFPPDNLLEQIASLVERGKVNKSSRYPPDLKDKDGVDELCLLALNSGYSPADLLSEALIAGMKRVGVKFRENKIFVPEVLIAAKAMKAGMVHLQPHFLSGGLKLKRKIIICTVSGDLHDIGKNILSMFLQGDGWEVIDLGVDVSPQKLLESARNNEPLAICLSALLTTTMMNMKAVVDLFRLEAPEIKILIGGAPITSSFSQEIGADFYSPEPQGAVEYLNRIKII